MATENEKALVNLLDRKQRQQNMDDILNALNPDKTEFNTMLLGFSDIIQNIFFNLLEQQTRNDKEREELEQHISDAVGEVMDTLNKFSLNASEDMVILSTIMIEAIAKTLTQQAKTDDVRISQKLHNLKKATR